jgi:hypothetical protein
MIHAQLDRPLTALIERLAARGTAPVLVATDRAALKRDDTVSKATLAKALKLKLVAYHGPGDDSGTLMRLTQRGVDVAYAINLEIAAKTLTPAEAAMLGIAAVGGAALNYFGATGAGRVCRSLRGKGLLAPYEFKLTREGRNVLVCLGKLASE